MFNTPILFLVFNRPDTTQQVFDVLRKIKPTKLFIAADGPRLDKEGEKEKCDAVRRIATQIDWECQLVTLFRDINLGCGKAVSEAITWFFDQVEEGIILEDDCLPDNSFFIFCTLLLDQYRNDNRVMHIGGSNFQFGIKRGDGDYYFSIISHVWGWATWRSAWRKYEFNLNEANDISDDKFNVALNNNKKFITYYKNIFHEMRNSGIDTWDYQWFYAIILNNGLTICPNTNLVKNIGFGKDATHTLNDPSWNILNTVKTIAAFKKPTAINIDYDADAFTFREIMEIREDVEIKKQYSIRNIKQKIYQLNRILKMIKRILNKLKRILSKNRFFKKTDHRKVFTRIYNQKIWGHPKTENPFYSGTGSDDEYAETYSSAISQFIIENNINSIVDLGCGDFRVGNKILMKSAVDYTGVDIVQDLIKYNLANFSNEKISFNCLNIVKDSLPAAELCTIRQVLQHLSNRDIKKVLQKCKKYKYVIVTEHLPDSESPCPNTDKNSDENIRLVYNSGVYLDKHPFNFEVKTLLTVYPEEEKGSKIVTFQLWINNSK